MHPLSVSFLVVNMLRFGNFMNAEGNGQNVGKEMEMKGPEPDGEGAGRKCVY